MKKVHIKTHRYDTHLVSIREDFINDVRRKINKPNLPESKVIRKLAELLNDEKIRKVAFNGVIGLLRDKKIK